MFLCKLLQRGGRAPIKCAVKKLIYRERDDEAAQKSLKEFERELKMMVPLNHQNIVRMYGECFYTFPGEFSVALMPIADVVARTHILFAAMRKVKIWRIVM